MKVLWLVTLQCIGVLLALCCSFCQTQRHFITGYYASWRVEEGGGAFAPPNLAYGQYDIIIYAFLSVEADGSLSLINPQKDKVLLLGPLREGVPAEYLKSADLGNPALHQPGQRFADYAHRHRVRLSASVGGWVHSTHFPSVAADPARRTRFASECARIIELYHLDGIDIDWEYPGDPARQGTPADRGNFTILLRQVRDTLQALRSRLRRDLMLTIACGAAPKHLAAIDWPKVHQLVNAVNLMTYSFYGQWDEVSNHNAPLFPSANATQIGYSCAEAVQILIRHGVPPVKINLGVAFYGRTHRTEGAPSLHAKLSVQSDSSRSASRGATASYSEIVQQINRGSFKYCWDDTAQVPYLIDTAQSLFISFDDERSVSLKAHYARLNGLRGVMIWDITSEYCKVDGQLRTPLTDAIRRVFSGKEILPSVLSEPRICVFPRVTYSGFLHFFVHSPEKGRTEISLSDARGKILHTVTFLGFGHTIDMRLLPSGAYRIRMRFNSLPHEETKIVKK
ncbi:MAG: glycoside hydrolase family 18 protein [Saprospiraceae bacterium]|nr:glycoside hydrolase family 18 protein [Saprospiraceae bacterium]MDW8483988.1 glycoside hydrolase family 18 protein [Saprospiraceae bacterium]